MKGLNEKKKKKTKHVKFPIKELLLDSRLGKESSRSLDAGSFAALRCEVPGVRPAPNPCCCPSRSSASCGGAPGDCALPAGPEQAAGGGSPGGRGKMPNPEDVGGGSRGEPRRALPGAGGGLRGAAAV